jgi:hypothetical protein
MLARLRESRGQVKHGELGARKSTRERGARSVHGGLRYQAATSFAMCTRRKK